MIDEAETAVAMRRLPAPMTPETSPAVRRILDKAELCFRLARRLGNRAGAARLDLLVLGHFYLEEADRVAMASPNDNAARPIDGRSRGPR
ncbi:MAG: hypothetical protein JO255_16015 [Alphaproteobacteria bacterium]|nr:hypothetical protein [Alphaproteobacteria bacterium]